jgi:hypothetical protein
VSSGHFPRPTNEKIPSRKYEQVGSDNGYVESF